MENHIETGPKAVIQNHSQNKDRLVTVTAVTVEKKQEGLVRYTHKHQCGILKINIPIRD